jgi:phosphatidylethanolamine-binding protein (PEBP) family uncharacterized protein
MASDIGSNGGAPRARARTWGCAVAIALALTACGSSGTELRDPPMGVTSPRPTSSTTTSTTAAPPVFTVSSPAFAFGAPLPDAYTCVGDDISPPLVWTAIPAGTVELAITITSIRDEEEQAHWILAGMPASTLDIPEDTVPLTAIEGPNSFGGFGWQGPCPETGETLEIDITLHALTAPSALTPEMTADEALAHLNGLPAVRTVATASSTGG